MGKPLFRLRNVCPDSEINDELEKLPENQLPEFQLLELQTGLSFELWEHVKKWFNTYSLQQGFSYKIRRSESDNEGIVRRLT